MLAISFSLQWIEKNRIRKGIICSESMSALVSINTMSADNRTDILYEIYECLFRLKNINSEVRFMWVPAHRGIEGNEIADFYAKQATKMNNMMEIPYSKAEIKENIKKMIMEEWQGNWIREEKGRHLYKIKEKVGKMENIQMCNRNQIISRMRMGHTGLNSTLFIIGKHNTGMCECGKDRETVEHIVCRCEKYIRNRKISRKLKMKDTEMLNLRSLFNGGLDVYKLIIEYLKNCKLINRI